jgi:prophage regulatory protein
MNPKPQLKGIELIETLRPAVLDIDQVAAYLSLSARTVNTMVQKSDFPKPRQLSGRRVGYLLREVDEWIESRPVSEQPPPVNSQFGRAGNPNKPNKPKTPASD